MCSLQLYLRRSSVLTSFLNRVGVKEFPVDVLNISRTNSPKQLASLPFVGLLALISCSNCPLWKYMTRGYRMYAEGIHKYVQE